MFNRSKSYPTWALISLAVNGLLLLVITGLLRDDWWPAGSQVNASMAQTNLRPPLPEPTSGLGPRHRLTYNRWVAILEQEAKVAAQNQPSHLNILAGDSLSLWFPPDLLPPEKSWLNQGISGEISFGLLQRLQLFERTQPETIFVMIGINDLIRGVADADLLWNYRLIIRRLQRLHPQAEIVVQSILPHGGDASTWEGRDRLLVIPNSRIRELNQQLEAIAQQESIKYLDLQPLFTDAQGNLRLELTTDGLHLSRQGYLVWRSALQVFSQLNRQQPPSADMESG